MTRGKIKIQQLEKKNPSLSHFSLASLLHNKLHSHQEHKSTTVTHEAAKSLLLPSLCYCKYKTMSNPSLISDLSFHKSFYKTNTIDTLTNLQYAKPRNLVPMFHFMCHPNFLATDPLVVALSCRFNALFTSNSHGKSPPLGAWIYLLGFVESSYVWSGWWPDLTRIMLRGF